MDRRVAELVTGIASYIDLFNVATLFTGPSLYFHLKTVELLRQYRTASVAIQNNDFVESLYATLTAWGMHRMGPRGAKLEDFGEVMASIAQQRSAIREVESLVISDIHESEIPAVGRHLWMIIRALRIGVGKTKLVAGSKALHHILPALIPPMDREYTLSFFYHHKTLNQDGESAFMEMYPRFALIARSCRLPIEAAIGVGMNTSVTKVLDNAIVGYVLKHIKGRSHPQGEPE